MIKEPLEGLVGSISMLGPILVPIFFVMLYYSIVGVHMFKGVTEIRCFKTPFPEEGVWELDDEIKNQCGIWQCPEE